MTPHPENKYLTRLLRLELLDQISKLSPIESIEIGVLRADFSDVLKVSDLRFAHGDLDESLREIEECLRIIWDPPFSGDEGCGISPAMPVRYEAKSEILRASFELITILGDTHQKLLEAFMTHQMRTEAVAIIASPIESKLKALYPEFYLFQSKSESCPAIWQTIRNHLRENVGDPDTVKPTDIWYDDIINGIEILMTLEEALGIEMNDPDKVRTLGELAAFIHANMP